MNVGSSSTMTFLKSVMAKTRELVDYESMMIKLYAQPDVVCFDGGGQGIAWWWNAPRV
jgi:hypothetical protein